MTTILPLLQILISLLLIGAILIQSQGTGLGSAWGGGGEYYRSKRGVEKILFKATIILSILFLASSVISAMI